MPELGQSLRKLQGDPQRLVPIGFTIGFGIQAVPFEFEIRPQHDLDQAYLAPLAVRFCKDKRVLLTLVGRPWESVTWDRPNPKINPPQGIFIEQDEAEPGFDSVLVTKIIFKHLERILKEEEVKYWGKYLRAGDQQRLKMYTLDQIKGRFRLFADSDPEQVGIKFINLETELDFLSPTA